MKAHLITTGTVFALIALMHILKGISDWRGMKTNPGEFFSLAALGLLAAALSIWERRLFFQQINRD